MPESICPVEDFELVPEPAEPAEPAPEPALPFSVAEIASQGGKARAEALPPETRREIARRAASTRWHASKPYATHEGVLKVGSLELPVAVLEGASRLESSQNLKS